jgi:hypothetical protein
MFMFLVIIIQMGHEYMTTGKTGGWLQNSCFHRLMAKQRDVTGFFSFLDFSTFQTMTMLLTIMTWPMTLCKVRHIFDLLNDTQNITLLLIIWLWMKL